MPAHALNALGHKVIAEIAWEELTPERRNEIIAVLCCHPRLDQDFAYQLPSDAEEDRWVFWQAAEDSLFSGSFSWAILATRYIQAHNCMGTC